MTYVRITDIAATWADYVKPGGLTESAGLIVFAAGPTDEGIRTVEVWASPTDWAHARRTADPPPDHANSTTREFEAPLSVLGLQGARTAMEEQP
ncbi:MAG TPA: hypothetical protein VM677_10795 [Actinokineospora sp.]|jgi:hypothetical protein|nr:hypothetical protein [Actinokineospora sp.]